MSWSLLQAAIVPAVPERTICLPDEAVQFIAERVLMSHARIDLRKLQHVVVLARERNYQRAARALGLTQSALTRSIQSLEARFAIRLFDRDRSGVRLTPVGRILAERAKVMLQDAGDLAQHLQRVGNGEEGEVAFGMSPLAAVCRH